MVDSIDNEILQKFSKNETKTIYIDMHADAAADITAVNINFRSGIIPDFRSPPRTVGMFDQLS